jgi:hypothetical protein
LEYFRIAGQDQSSGRRLDLGIACAAGGGAGRKERPNQQCQANKIARFGQKSPHLKLDQPLLYRFRSTKKRRRKQHSSDAGQSGMSGFFRQLRRTQYFSKINA